MLQLYACRMYTAAAAAIARQTFNVDELPETTDDVTNQFASV